VAAVPDRATPAPDPPGEVDLPPRVSISLDDSCLSYMRDRLRQVMFESYAGLPLGKFPEDLRMYEHLLWASRSNVVVEIGCNQGGSALWFRDRLDTMARHGHIGAGQVISIDLDVEPARRRLESVPGHDITLLAGDVLDPELPDRVRRLLPADARCFVVEDSAHTYQTTLAALEGFAPLVAPGGYLVVEDGCVDVEELRLVQSWPRGVLPALANWLASPGGAQFVARPDLERYGVSCHPGGFLQRRRGKGL
jgi:cephalosporin hydroxylase